MYAIRSYYGVTPAERLRASTVIPAERRGVDPSAVTPEASGGEVAAVLEFFGSDPAPLDGRLISYNFV